jgi:hypothetical protein
MRDNVRANRNYFRARGGEAEMSEMWEQEGFSCAGSDLRGDVKKELKASHITARASWGCRSASQTPALGHYLLSLCNWYRSLFTDCFRTVGDTYLQYAVVEASLNLVLINRIGEAE